MVLVKNTKRSFEHLQIVSVNPPPGRLANGTFWSFGEFSLHLHLFHSNIIFFLEGKRGRGGDIHKPPWKGVLYSARFWNIRVLIRFHHYWGRITLMFLHPTKMKNWNLVFSGGHTWEDMILCLGRKKGSSYLVLIKLS